MTRAMAILVIIVNSLLGIGRAEATLCLGHHHGEAGHHHHHHHHGHAHDAHHHVQCDHHGCSDHHVPHDEGHHDCCCTELPLPAFDLQIPGTVELVARPAASTIPDLDRVDAMDRMDPAGVLLFDPGGVQRLAIVRATRLNI